MIKNILLIVSLISLICGIILICISAHKLKSADKKTIQKVYPLHKRLITTAQICFAVALAGGIVGIFLNS